MAFFFLFSFFVLCAMQVTMIYIAAGCEHKDTVWIKRVSKRCGEWINKESRQSFCISTTVWRASDSPEENSSTGGCSRCNIPPLITTLYSNSSGQKQHRAERFKKRVVKARFMYSAGAQHYGVVNSRFICFPTTWAGSLGTFIFDPIRFPLRKRTSLNEL